MWAVTFPVDSIFPNYPEGWLAAHHSLRSVVEARGLVAVLAQPGHSLEVCGDNKKGYHRTFLFNSFLEYCD